MTFGTSLRLDDGDLVFDGPRLRDVDGIDNLTQALTLRILTPLGSDRFNTRYGMDLAAVFTAPSGIRMAKELIKLNLVGTLGSDPRVREVRRVTFDDDPERLAGDRDGPARARDARHRRRWTVEVVVDTVDADAVTLLVDVEV
jgi:phage baseplate assembly protein W